MKLTTVFLFITLLTTAQKSNQDIFAVDYKTTAKSSYPYTVLKDTSEESIRTFLFRHISALQHSDVSLQLIQAKESMAALHYEFQQLYKKVPVYRGSIKISISKKGVVQSVFDNSFTVNEWSVPAPDTQHNAMWFIKNNEPVLAIYSKNHDFEYLHHATTGEMLYSRNLNVYYAVPDSLVSGKVYLPDPITTAQQPYNGTYVDNNDANAPWLEVAQQTVSFRADFNGSFFALSNPYTVIIDFDTPQIAPVTSTIPQFNFNRSQSGFEDVNVFYHLNNYRQYLSSLGISLGENLVWADPHAIFGSDNSYFAPGYVPPRLYFGTGGVDDAEDADVIIHEYGHFLSFNAAPNTNSGNQRNSLDEGLGDYLASSYSRTYNNYRKEWVFNWDGHNEYWNGRVVNTSRKFPNDLASSIYRNGEMWATALINLHDEIGREATDSVLFESLYAYAADMAMDDGAYLLLNADSNLNNGAYHCPIYKHMMNQGFLPFFQGNPCGFTNIASEENLPIYFAQNGYSFTISNEEQVPMRYCILNIEGKLVHSVTDINQSLLSYENSNLPSGIYLVQITAANNITKIFKWCKTH